MIKSLIESMIDALCTCFGVARFKPVPRLRGEATVLLNRFLKEQQEIAARANYFACC